MAAHILVLGAGIVGTASAVALLDRGHRVTLVDPAEPGGMQAASYGNGGWISPASVVPMSMPGLWRRLPATLRDPEGPLTIQWRSLPVLAPWILRFLSAGRSVARVERTARALSSLLHDAPARHAALADAIGEGDLIRRTGLLYAYPDRAGFEAEALAWRLRRDNGVRIRELDENALRGFEPALGRHYRFGALVEDGAHCFDPGAYVGAIARHAEERGARLVATRATGFAIEGGRLRAVETDAGPIECDGAVIACGIGSRALARAAGDRVPLISERGYHAQIADAPFRLATPVMPSDGRMANTSVRGGLRIAGQVELASERTPPDWRRVDVLLRHAAATYPGLELREGEGVSLWMGNRPSTPDGLPVIGRASGSADIVHAFGHGHVGLAAAPATAELVADCFETDGARAAAFDPRRF